MDISDAAAFTIHTVAVDGDIAIANTHCYAMDIDVDTVAWTMREKFKMTFPRTRIYQTITSPTGRNVGTYGTPPRVWRG